MRPRETSTVASMSLDHTVPSQNLSLPHADVYTDGGCDPNPGPGGWGAVIRLGEHTADDRSWRQRMSRETPLHHKVLSSLAGLSIPGYTMHVEQHGGRIDLTNPRVATGDKPAGPARRDCWPFASCCPIYPILPWEAMKSGAGKVRVFPLPVSGGGKGGRSLREPGRRGAPRLLAIRELLPR